MFNYLLDPSPFNFRTAKRAAPLHVSLTFNTIFRTAGRCAFEPVTFSLLRCNCVPILLYDVGAAPLWARQIQSIEFTITRIFMKRFRTESANKVIECHKCRLPAKHRTAKFLQNNRFVPFTRVYYYCVRKWST